MLLQGIEGSTAIGVTQVVTTSVGMTDIDIRAVSVSNGLIISRYSNRVKGVEMQVKLYL